MKSKTQRPFTAIMAIAICLTFFYFFSFSSSLPSVPRLNTGVPISRSIKRYNMNAITATATAAENKERVLILTPLAKFYDEYWSNLIHLTYPHELIDLGFIVPKGREHNAVLQSLEQAVANIQTGSKKHRFGSVQIVRQDFETTTSQREQDRHRKEAQKERRSALALARNELLLSALTPSTSWVLHLDADIVETPPSLIEDLTRHNKDIIVPNCYQRYIDNGEKKSRAYDFNSWHDSDTAIQLANSLAEDDIILEGYADMATYRTLMAYEYQEGEDANTETELDGVGGTALLVKAGVHRDGAIFPTWSFYHLIETEGFAKMARRLGYKCWGLPNYLVYHYNE